MSHDFTIQCKSTQKVKLKTAKVSYKRDRSTIACQLAVIMANYMIRKPTAIFLRLGKFWAGQRVFFRSLLPFVAPCEITSAWPALHKNITRQARSNMKLREFTVWPTPREGVKLKRLSSVSNDRSSSRPVWRYLPCLLVRFLVPLSKVIPNRRRRGKSNSETIYSYFAEVLLSCYDPTGWQ